MISYVTRGSPERILNKEEKEAGHIVGDGNHLIDDTSRPPIPRTR